MGLRSAATAASLVCPVSALAAFHLAARILLERNGFVWVWPGEPAKADPAKLHRLPLAESDAWRYGGGLFHIACDYRLMIDNLILPSRHRALWSISSPPRPRPRIGIFVAWRGILPFKMKP
jgi:hypothetical protein